jgi:hypothetical protein
MFPRWPPTTTRAPGVSFCNYVLVNFRASLFRQAVARALNQMLRFGLFRKPEHPSPLRLK